MLDDLRKARSTPVALWVQFTNKFKRDGDELCIFVEGRDDVTFYLAMLRAIEPTRSVHTIDCENKRGVHAALAEIRKKENGVPARCLFLTDKDHDDLLKDGRVPDDDVYETACYAIENELVTEGMLVNVWREVLGLSADHPGHALAVSEFKLSLDRFYHQALPMMAIVLAMRLNGVPLNLNNVNPATLFSFVDDTCRVRRTEGAARLLVQRSGGQVPRWRDLSSALREIRRHPPKAVVRGKLELWFFWAFVVRMAANVKQDKGQRLAKANTSALPALSAAMAILAPRHQPAPALRDYVRKRLVKDVGVVQAQV